MTDNNKDNEDINKLNFETALAEFENIVEKLETGQVDLDEAINTYTRGHNLKEHCENKLSEAKLKIEKIGDNKE